MQFMKKKRITIIIFTIYLAFIFLYPLLRGSIAHINGYPSYFEKTLKCINIIPFYFDYTVMPSVIIKNIIFKICLFIPVGYMLFTKKTKSNSNCENIIINRIFKRDIPLINFIRLF